MPAWIGWFSHILLLHSSVTLWTEKNGEEGYGGTIGLCWHVLVDVITERKQLK